MQRLGEQVAGSRGVPRSFLAAYASRPHEIQHRREADDDIDGMLTFHFIAQDCAGCVERHEQFFAHDVVGSDIDAGHGFRAIVDATEHASPIGLGRSVLRTECDVEGIGQLQRISPELQPVLRVAEDRRAATVDCHEPRRLRGFDAPGQRLGGARGRRAEQRRPDKAARKPTT